VAKPTLGRGLGDLLDSNRAGAEPAPARSPGPGLRILIDGAQPRSESLTKTSESPVSALPGAVTQKEMNGEALTRQLAMLGLVGADVALLGWTVHFVAIHRYTLEAGAMAACAGSVCLAAFCGCAAARLAVRERA
jgi:hypothetical protein